MRTYFLLADLMLTIHSAIVSTLLRIVAGRVVANDHNHLKCTDEAGALEHWESDRNGKHNSVSNSLYCPRPESQPTRICSSARFYIERTGHTRETRVSFIDGGKDRDAGLHVIQKYGLTCESLIEDAYNMYERTHNEGALSFDQFGALDFVKNGFQMPVCVHNNQRLVDFTAGRSRELPMVCGDRKYPSWTSRFHTARETAFNVLSHYISLFEKY